MLAKAQCQSPKMVTGPPPSGASPLPHLFCVVWKIKPAHLPAYALFKPCTKPLWEQACSRKRSVSHRIYRLNHRLRGQAPSHICFCVVWKIRPFGGKPPPTFVFVLFGRSGRRTCLLTHCSNLAQNPCGGGLAREGAVSVTEFVD
ncbi:hypothetical protein FPT15_03375 [Pseudomonas sp. RGB]|nr:hypothetical protein FPT15_03375 [Pseudomonas sp. RGB]